MLLLQISTSTTETIVNNPAADSLSLFDLMMKGGLMMYPIYILSIVAVYIFVERIRTINRASKVPVGFMENIKRLVTDGDLKSAKVLCQQSDTPIARMIGKGLSRIGSPLKNIEVSIENAGKIEIYNLEKNLGVMATVAGAAPMIGFLGTVTGMISAFMAIAQEEGAVSPKLLSSGIYEAMLTTAAGLIVGIIAYLAYNYLVTRLQKVINNMEYISIDFIDLLQEPR
jgi:biopolymer transport protein ExbB